MAEELVDKDQLHSDGRAGPHVNFPREGEQNSPQNGHLDGYCILANRNITFGATVYLDDVDCLPRRVVPFDLESDMVLLDKREIFVLDMV